MAAARSGEDSLGGWVGGGKVNAGRWPADVFLLDDRADRILLFVVGGSAPLATGHQGAISEAVGMRAVVVPTATRNKAEFRQLCARMRARYAGDGAEMRCLIWAVRRLLATQKAPAAADAVRRDSKPTRRLRDPSRGTGAAAAVVQLRSERRRRRFLPPLVPLSAPFRRRPAGTRDRLPVRL
uniref:Uncharacterized protein n=1 Tax=Plectus sambesii TaxID=2011161 RepID=A0A914WJM9_9BILA